MSRIIQLTIMVLFLAPVSVNGQAFDRMTIPFSIDGRSMPLALAGGLNSPQFSLTDLNFDSIPDLFVFDRSGNKVLPFLGKSNESLHYDYAPQLEGDFPQLDAWALLRDFNSDSIADIFSFSTTGAPGIDVYQGQIENDRLTFKKMSFDNGINVLGYPTASGAMTNIYVSAIDIPSIVDVDGDGDLDVMSFQSEGTKVFLYRNLVIEQSLPLDTFDFILEDRCWGKFVEAFNTNDVILSSDPDVCPENFQAFQRLHSGSTVTAFDADLDGDQDLLLGDISFETLLFLTNGGTAEKAFIVEQSQHFPSYDQPVEIPFFPVAYIQDFDQDGHVDMIAAPNQDDSRENVAVSWYYSGSETSDGVRFTLNRQNLIVEDMLDFGTDASPLFHDFTGDGLIDICVGSRFHSNHDNAFPSQLFLFENVGTLTQPAYELIDEDYLSLKDHVDEIDALNPEVVDIDQDGDKDLVVGNKRGKLIFVENVAIPGTEFTPGTITYPWFDIDIGFASAPAFHDLDADGDLDLLIGEERGNINLFLNHGSAQIPLFDPDPTADGNQERFGAIDARQDRAVFGAAAPTIYTSGDSSVLLVGTTFGNFLSYSLTDIKDTLRISKSELDHILDGRRSQSDLADIDNDGFLELLTGSSRGGLSLYNTSFRASSSVPTMEYPDISHELFIMPNPVEEHLSIHSDVLIKGIEMINQIGQVLMVIRQPTMPYQINVSNLLPGVYFLRISTSDGIGIKKMIKEK